MGGTGGISGGAHNAGGSAASSGGGIVLDGAGGLGAAASAGQCSADLRSIVDAQGSLLKSCSDDEACAGGSCIAACDAAARSRGSVGCEFWALEPPFIYNGQSSRERGPCYAAFVANAWSRPAKLSVTRAGLSLDVTSFARIPRGSGKSTQYEALPATGLPPNEVAVLFLSHEPGTRDRTSLECPVAPAVLADAAIQGSGHGAAFHIVSDTPISAYDILPYGGASSYLPSATLLLPATTWGTNYIALAPRNGGSGQLWTSIVAREDGTTVDVAPRKALPGSDSLPSAPVGQVMRYTLSAGEAIQWIDLERGKDFDPSGSVFESNKPIGLWAGNTALNVDSATSPNGGSSDSAHQQLPPIQSLGSAYVGPSIATRLPNDEPESVPYRLLGVVDGTELTWDPAPPSAAPLTLDKGQIAEFQTIELFSVRSQDAEHPFVFTQYMPGTPKAPLPGGCGSNCYLGDDEWVSLIPAEQFLTRYVFFTDPSYATTTLVVIRKKGAAGFADVELECLGTLEGWQPVGTEGDFEVAHVHVVRGTLPLGTCSTSRHIASSREPFGVVVWGTDDAASYAYPAGGNLAAVNGVIVPPIVR